MPVEDSEYLWGLLAIGREAGCLGEDGEVSYRVTHDRVKRGLIPAQKRGGLWQSTRSAIRQALNPIQETQGNSA
jgi:hypothetical protein